MNMTWQNPVSDEIKSIIDMLVKQGAKIIADNRIGPNIKTDIRSRVLTLQFESLIIRVNDNATPTIEIADSRNQALLMDNGTMLKHIDVLKALIIEFDKMVKAAYAQQQGQMKPMK